MRTTKAVRALRDVRVREQQERHSVVLHNIAFQLDRCYTLREVPAVASGAVCANALYVEASQLCSDAYQVTMRSGFLQVSPRRGYNPHDEWCLFETREKGSRRWWHFFAYRDPSVRQTVNAATRVAAYDALKPFSAVTTKLEANPCQ